MTTTTDPPVPTKVYRTYFPAGANIPGITQRLRGKVYVTDAGLFVYQNRTTLQEAAPDFHSPIIFEETPDPPSDYASGQSGWVLTTEAGKVLVRKLGSCPCAFRKLKAWTPTWAGRETAWRG